MDGLAAANWGVVFGLALLALGGLVVWAYGGRGNANGVVLTSEGFEFAATQRFHVRRGRLFYRYGQALCGVGAAVALGSWVVG